jgi:hypothetical protein
VPRAKNRNAGQAAVDCGLHLAEYVPPSYNVQVAITLMSLLGTEAAATALHGGRAVSGSWAARGVCTGRWRPCRAHHIRPLHCWPGPGRVAR